ncbi:MAG TPA: serine/threonine-protein kinase, partial [Blastocatellia bacterium]|nr:serine/threonine-protein kinase [Blastocatellia bacterium]
MAADWQRVRKLFEDALDCERGARAAFLDESCGADLELRREVDSLLEEHDRPGSFVADSPIARVAGLSEAGTGPARAKSSALNPGEVLGERYRIEAEVGRGGMGEVYRARDARLGRDVALKVMPALSVTDPDRLRRFDLEARAAGALNHPNVLAIHDVGVHDGAPYIVSELLVGETLRARLTRGQLPLDKAIDYGVQVARGLVAAHDKGIVHRDLKLENLFLTKDGRVKILDFGIAKLMDTSGVAGSDSVNSRLVQHTESGAVMGTASYMSPEQALGEAVDHRSDIFSLGVILYELVTGQRAFDRRSRAETMNAIINEEPVPPSEINPSVGPSLERAMLHCLEKNPDERFQTARDLCFALGELSTLSAAKVAVAPTPHRQWRWPRYALWGTAVVVIVAAGLGAYRIFRTGSESHFEPTIRQITFRRGSIPFQSARFTPDGQTIVYSAAWDGGPTELYLGRTDSVESRPLGFPAGR